MPARLPKRFRAPKGGNRPAEYEDASKFVGLPLPSRRGNQRGVARVAVADGASESAFARPWAEILAKAFVAPKSPLDLSGLTEESLKSWLKPRQDEWSRGVPWQRIPWHGEAKARAGAMATLLGVTFRAAPGGGGIRWQAAAVGDCCLFVVQNDALELAWPLDASSQFNNTPSLICSNPANDQWQLNLCAGECRPGRSLFILASDALSQWLLREYESGGKPWRTLLNLERSDWPDWLGQRRQERTMTNDDTTVVIANI